MVGCGTTNTAASKVYAMSALIVVMLAAGASVASAEATSLVVFEGVVPDGDAGATSHLGEGGWSAVADEAASAPRSVSGMWVTFDAAQPDSVTATLTLNGEPTGISCTVTPPLTHCAYSAGASGTIAVHPHDTLLVRLHHQHLAAGSVQAVILLDDSVPPRYVDIAEISPMTGTLPNIGTDSRLASQLAVSDFNEYLAGKGADWRLRTVPGDSGTAGSLALEEVMRMKERGISVVVGAMTSHATTISYNFIHENDMLLITTGSTSPLFAIPDSVFRTIPDDTEQTHLIAGLIDSRQAGALIIVYRDDPWGVALADGIAGDFGGEVVRIPYRPGDADFGLVAEDVRNAASGLSDTHGDSIAVLVIGFGETADILAEASTRQLGQYMWFGSTGNARNPSILSNPEAAAFAEDVGFLAPAGHDPHVDLTLKDAVSFPIPVVPSYEDELVSRIAEYTYENAGRYPIGPYGYGAYDAVWLAGLAMYHGGFGLDSMLDAMPDVAADRHGASGPLALSGNGDLTHTDYGLWTVQNGEWKILAKLNEDTGRLLSVDEVQDTIWAQYAVSAAISEFELTGTVVFDRISNPSDAVYGGGVPFVFVLGKGGLFDAHTETALAGADSRAILDSEGASLYDLLANKPPAQGSWILYSAGSGAAGDGRASISWIVPYEGYVFGAGIYLQDYR